MNIVTKIVGALMVLAGIIAIVHVLVTNKKEK